jgi:hypothetical protein
MIHFIEFLKHLLEFNRWKDKTSFVFTLTTTYDEQQLDMHARNEKSVTPFLAHLRTKCPQGELL